LCKSGRNSGIKKKGLFSAAEIERLKNTASLPSGKHRLSIALFHFIAKVQQFAILAF